MQIRSYTSYQMSREGVGVDRAGQKSGPMSGDEIKVVCQAVAEGEIQKVACARLPDRDPSTVKRAYNIAVEFQRRNLISLDDHTALSVAQSAGYAATTSYVKRVFIAWRARIESVTQEVHLGEIHEEGLRGILIRWLDLEEDVTLNSWLQILADYFLSPAGLLNFARTTLHPPSGHEPSNQAFSANQARDGLLQSYGPQLELQAPPELIRSSQFELILQRLKGDALWEQYKLADDALARLSAYVWVSATQLISFAFGLSIWPTVLGDSGQAESSLNRIIQHPSYRDTASKALSAVVHLLGGELMGRGAQENELLPDARGVINQFNLEMEDKLQRADFPEDWSRPSVGELREIANQLWDGTLGEELSQWLGKETVNELLRLWLQWSQASEVLRLRLRTLVSLQP